MNPLNYVILRHFTKTDKSCADDVIESLKGVYGNFKALKKPSVIEALMTAQANGLIEEVDVNFDNNGDLRIYYHATEENIATINK